MVDYQEMKVNLTNIQLKKLRSAAKSKKGTILMSLLMSLLTVCQQI